MSELRPGEPHSLQLLIQGIAVAVQRGKPAAVRGPSPLSDNVLYLTIHIFGRDASEILQLLTGEIGCSVGYEHS